MMSYNIKVGHPYQTRKIRTNANVKPIKTHERRKTPPSNDIARAFVAWSPTLPVIHSFLVVKSTTTTQSDSATYTISLPHDPSQFIIFLFYSFLFYLTRNLSFGPSLSLISTTTTTTTTTTMAKFALTFSLLCLFFFAISQARFESDLPLNDAVGTEILPEANHHEISTTADSIALPTEKPESDWESVTKVPVKLEAIEENDAVPLTVVRFRPVNRHFPRRPFPLTLRHGRRCRQHFKPWGPRRPHADGDFIPFGDDMILSGGDRLDSDPVFRDGVRQIPARWIKIRHVEPRFPLRHGDEIEWPHHHHRHHHDHDRDGDRDRDHHHDHDHYEHKHEHENPFLKGFRKFMNHF